MFSFSKELRKEDMKSKNFLFFIGFRFQPIDKELVYYFLLRKINGDSINQDRKIKDINIFDLYINFKIVCMYVYINFNRMHAYDLY